MKRRSGYWIFPLLAIVALVFAFVFTRHMWFDALSPDDKPLFWTNLLVAVGTLALAVITVVSVFQTRTVISSEDRRHQQSFAPLLTVGDYFNSREEYQSGFTLCNIGKGVALNVTVQVTGEATTTTANLPPGAFGYKSEEELKAFRKKHEVREITAINDSYLCSALTDGGSVLFLQRFFAARYTFITDVRYSRCVISYHDMFGNRYSTEYDDDRLASYRWTQPEHLRIPRHQTRTD